MLSALRRASEEAVPPPPPPPVGIVVTDTNLNPILQMMTWLLLAMTALMLCFRFLTKFFLKTNQRFGWEEVLITLAFVRGMTFLLLGSGFVLVGLTKGHLARGPRRISDGSPSRRRNLGKDTK